MVSRLLAHPSLYAAPPSPWTQASPSSTVCSRDAALTSLLHPSRSDQPWRCITWFPNVPRAAVQPPASASANVTHAPARFHAPPTHDDPAQLRAMFLLTSYVSMAQLAAKLKRCPVLPESPASMAPSTTLPHLDGRSPSAQLNGHADPSRQTPEIAGLDGFSTFTARLHQPLAPPLALHALSTPTPSPPLAPLHAASLADSSHASMGPSNLPLTQPSAQCSPLHQLGLIQSLADAPEDFSEADSAHGAHSWHFHICLPSDIQQSSVHYRHEEHPCASDAFPLLDSYDHTAYPDTHLLGPPQRLRADPDELHAQKLAEFFACNHIGTIPQPFDVCTSSYLVLYPLLCDAAHVFPSTNDSHPADFWRTTAEFISLADIFGKPTPRLQHLVTPLQLPSTSTRSAVSVPYTNTTLQLRFVPFVMLWHPLPDPHLDGITGSSIPGPHATPFLTDIDNHPKIHLVVQCPSMQASNSHSQPLHSFCGHQQRPLPQCLVLHPSKHALQQRILMQSQGSYEYKCSLLVLYQLPCHLGLSVPHTKLISSHIALQNLSNAMFKVLHICAATNPVHIYHLDISLRKSMDTTVFNYQPFDPGTLPCCISQLEGGELVTDTSLSYADSSMRDHKMESSSQQLKSLMKQSVFHFELTQAQIINRLYFCNLPTTS